MLHHNGTCELCPHGTYNDDQIATDSCTDCPADLTTIVLGARNVTQCVKGKNIKTISIFFFVKPTFTLQPGAINYEGVMPQLFTLKCSYNID